MKQFQIEDEVVDLVHELAKPLKPFEGFSDALRRVLTQINRASSSGRPQRQRSVEELLAELEAIPGGAEKLRESRRRRAPSPDPRPWVSRIPELRGISGLNSWKAVCDHLRVEVGGDSARRVLGEWVKEKHPR